MNTKTVLRDLLILSAGIVAGVCVSWQHFLKSFEAKLQKEMEAVEAWSQELEARYETAYEPCDGSDTAISKNVEAAKAIAKQAGYFDDMDYEEFDGRMEETAESNVVLEIGDQEFFGGSGEFMELTYWIDDGIFTNKYDTPVTPPEFIDHIDLSQLEITGVQHYLDVSTGMKYQITCTSGAEGGPDE